MVHRRPCAPMHRQRGNMLILLLLTLILTAMGAAGYVNGKQIELRTQAGQVEATVLDQLRDAANNLISENLLTILEGKPIDKNGLSVAMDAGIWRPTVVQLRDMGYLPEGWNATTSSLNGGDYMISFQRTPAGCVMEGCQVVGAVVLMKPINDEATGHSDGVVIGPILNKLGADAGVSLSLPEGNPQKTGREFLTGYSSTWSMPNPVLGHPQGVVGVQIGTTASEYRTFVRIGDYRDPQLIGNFSARGDLDIGGKSTFRGDMTVTHNASLYITQGDTTCSKTPPGTTVISLTCDGVLNAASGQFRQGLTAGNLDIARNDPNELVIRSGEMVIRSANGTGFIRFTQSGSVTISGGLTTGETVTAPNLLLNRPVREGEGCTPTTLAVLDVLDGGGLALCSPAGVYAAILRQGQAGQACPRHGSQATDARDGTSLICHGTTWVPVEQMMSKFTLMQTITVRHGTPVAMPTCTAAAPSMPLLFLMPANDASNLPSPPRNAYFRGGFVNPLMPRGPDGAGNVVGGEWSVQLTDAQGVALTASNALAMTYCYYP